MLVQQVQQGALADAAWDEARETYAEHEEQSGILHRRIESGGADDVVASS